MAYRHRMQCHFATLGSGSNVTANFIDAQDSICPKGWKMPSYSGNSNNPGADSYLNLIRTTYTVGESYYNDPLGWNKISNWPLNFMRTGSYANSRVDFSGFISGYTRFGYWWSSTGGSYLLVSMSSDGINQSSTYHRGWGLAIRCVVRS